VVGDIAITLLDIELLTLKLRLFISSAQTAREMGLDWWSGDPFFSSGARRLDEENRELRERLARLERSEADPAVTADDAGRESPDPTDGERAGTSVGDRKHERIGVEERNTP